MNGRIYDPLLGRFLSADLGVQFPGDLQSYNRYSYVRNNPLSKTDPSGFDETPEQKAAREKAEKEKAEKAKKDAEEAARQAHNRSVEAGIWGVPFHDRLAENSVSTGSDEAKIDPNGVTSGVSAIVSSSRRHDKWDARENAGSIRNLDEAALKADPKLRALIEAIRKDPNAQKLLSLLIDKTLKSHEARIVADILGHRTDYYGREYAVAGRITKNLSVIIGSPVYESDPRDRDTDIPTHITGLQYAPSDVALFIIHTHPFGSEPPSGADFGATSYKNFSRGGYNFAIAAETGEVFVVSPNEGPVYKGNMSIFAAPSSP